MSSKTITPSPGGGGELSGLRNFLLPFLHRSLVHLDNHMQDRLFAGGEPGTIQHLADCREPFKEFPPPFPIHADHHGPLGIPRPDHVGRAP